VNELVLGISATSFNGTLHKALGKGAPAYFHRPSILTEARASVEPLRTARKRTKRVGAPDCVKSDFGFSDGPVDHRHHLIQCSSYARRLDFSSLLGIALSISTAGHHTHVQALMNGCACGCLGLWRNSGRGFGKSVNELSLGGLSPNSARLSP